MNKELLDIVASIGVSSAVVVLMFYLWLKKVIISNIIKPELAQIELELKEVQKEIIDLKTELNKKDDKLEKIEDLITKNSETLNEIKAVFNLLKGRIEINFKHEEN